MTDEQAMQEYPEFTDIIEQSSMHPDESDDYPVTDLAATEGQLFNTDGTETVHNRRQYIERGRKNSSRLRSSPQDACRRDLPRREYAFPLAENQDSN